MNEPWAWICISGEALQIIAAINHTCFSSGLLSSEFIKSLFWQDEVFWWLNWPKEPHNLQRAQITVGCSCDIRAARTGAGFTLAEWMLHWVMRTRGHYYYELACIFNSPKKKEGSLCSCCSWKHEYICGKIISELDKWMGADARASFLPGRRPLGLRPPLINFQNSSR